MTEFDRINTRVRKNRKNIKNEMVNMMVMQGRDWNYYEVCGYEPEYGLYHEVTPHMLVILYKDDSYEGGNEPLDASTTELAEKFKVTDLDFIIHDSVLDRTPNVGLELKFPNKFGKYLANCWAYMNQEANRIKADYREIANESILLIMLYEHNSMQLHEQACKTLQPVKDGLYDMEIKTILSRHQNAPQARIAHLKYAVYNITPLLDNIKDYAIL